MAKKPYSPMASYEALKEAEAMIEAAGLDDLKTLTNSHGPKIGYKAFCYMLGGKMTAAAMKPDEACLVASEMEQGNNAASSDVAAALDIYKEVVAAHPEHPIAGMKVGPQ